jgi:predicted dehydrogenase
MASNKIRLGVIGANATKGWAPRAHLPALLASPDMELTAVCTTRPESAAEAAQKYGARLAFHDYRDLLACPDIDAVAVVVRVPSHCRPASMSLRNGL